MTDLLDVIPDFPLDSYHDLIATLEKYLISTSDLLTSDGLEIARRARLPILDVKRFVEHVCSHIHDSYGLLKDEPHSTWTDDEKQITLEGEHLPVTTGLDLISPGIFISALDEAFDTALNGGIAPGYLTEVTGESGAGKTQFLLTLLLSAQLPVPQGLGKGTIYISTEHPLPTQRLESILKFNPKFRNHTSPPSLDRVFSIHIPDLETQEHILSYQLPVVVQSKDIGLVIIDSITSNYRAEVGMSRSDDGGRSRGKALAARSIDLIKTGALLRNIARKYCCAIVVANQVLDRFEQRNIFLAPECLLRTPLSQGTRNRENKIEKEPVNDSLDLRASETVLARSSPLLLSKNSPSPSPSPIPNWPVSTLSQLPSTALLDPRLTLDYQLRFFTGWGDNENHRQENSKTPALGLAWANQIACRIAIIREGSIVNTQSAFSEYDDLDTRKLPESGLGGADWSRRGLRRWMRVVFSAWAPGVVEGDKGVEFEIWEGGLRAVARK